jgi:replicative DNA helicase
MNTETIEYRILSLLRSREAYLMYSPIVKEYLFETNHTKYIYRLIIYYHKHAKGKALAPLSSLFALIDSRIKENERAKYKEIIKAIKKYKFTDLTIAGDVVKKFAKKQLVRMMILDAVHSLDKEEDINVDRLRSRIDEALMVDSADLLDTAYDYFSNPTQRLQQEKDEPRISTGLSNELDNAIHRGLAAGEIGIIVAPTKVGKTNLLLNLSYNAIKQGYKVLYVTLELNSRKIAGRFDQIVANKSYEELQENSTYVIKAQRKLANYGGGFRIKDSTASKLSPNELSVYLERLRREFEFDMVMVDQIDLMYSPKEYKERRHELSSIVISLRRMGSSFNVPIWSASQATRKAGEEGNTTLWDIAEDIGKANWADVILTLSQAPEDKDDNMMILDTAGNRIGAGNPRVILTIDPDTLRIKGDKVIKMGEKK